MNILLVGEHPQGVTGNSHMMGAVVNQIDLSKHRVCLFVSGRGGGNQLWEMPPTIHVIEALEIEVNEQGGISHYDPWGAKKLVNTLSSMNFDLVVSVGIDLWRYVMVYDQINQIRVRKRFKLGAIFPYDLPHLRKDWLDWINFYDYPAVYSQFGYEILSKVNQKVFYFRPALFQSQKFKKYPSEERQKMRRSFFPTIPEDHLVFGFVGKNQFRKDPQRLIKSFMLAKKQYPKMTMYLHADMKGVFNLEQIMSDYGGQTGDFIIKPPGVAFDTEKMVALYNSLDCLVNCTLNEGLSWTIVEAQLCGLPIIASETTAQTELLNDGSGILVPCKELAYLPVVTRSGQSWVETNACKVEDMTNAIVTIAKSKELREDLSRKALEAGNRWVSGVHNFEEKFMPIVKKQIRNAVLFVQHSAAGDVLMTTKAFAGIKKRHPGVPFVYMTQKKYHDILVNNPFVNAVVDYDFGLMAEFSVVYNPHAERILPGHWGRNSNSLLSDFYWKILEVDRGDFFLDKVAPPLGLIARTPLASNSKPIAVLHTTGGDPRFRTYMYMGVVAKYLKEKGYYTVQLGTREDYPADAEFDLRGMLSFRESAWVMSKAKLAVTVDSFISHLAGMYGVSQVCLFGSGNQFVVRPEQLGGKLICLSPDYIRYCPGLGPCSGSVRDCPHPCTGLHDPQLIIEKIEEIEEGEADEQNGDSQQYAERDRAASAMV